MKFTQSVAKTPYQIFLEQKKNKNKNKKEKNNKDFSVESTLFSKKSDKYLEQKDFLKIKEEILKSNKKIIKESGDNYKKELSIEKDKREKADNLIIKSIEKMSASLSELNTQIEKSKLESWSLGEQKINNRLREDDNKRANESSRISKAIDDINKQIKINKAESLEGQEREYIFRSKFETEIKKEITSLSKRIEQNQIELLREQEKKERHRRDKENKMSISTLKIGDDISLIKKNFNDKEKEDKKNKLERDKINIEQHKDVLDNTEYIINDLQNIDEKISDLDEKENLNEKKFKIEVDKKINSIKDLIKSENIFSREKNESITDLIKGYRTVKIDISAYQAIEALKTAGWTYNDIKEELSDKDHSFIKKSFNKVKQHQHFEFLSENETDILIVSLISSILVSIIGFFVFWTVVML